MTLEDTQERVDNHPHPQINNIEQAQQTYDKALMEGNLPEWGVAVLAFIADFE